MRFHQAAEAFFPVTRQQGTVAQQSEAAELYAAAATFLRVLAAMTSRPLMATLTRAEAGEPPPVIARVRLSAASTRPMTAKTKAGWALLGSFAARRERMPLAREKPLSSEACRPLFFVYGHRIAQASSQNCHREKDLKKRNAARKGGTETCG